MQGNLLPSPRLILLAGAAVLGAACQAPPPPRAEAVSDLPSASRAASARNLALRPGRTAEDDLARYLAGLDGRPDAPLAPLRDDPAWLAHADALSTAFRNAESARLTRVDRWQRRELSRLGLQSAIVFYPFSGPDFLYVDSFFPDANIIVMCGLERVYPIPDPAALGDAGRAHALSHLRSSLATPLGASYFITREMRDDFGASAPLPGVLPPLYVFLVRSGHRIESVRPVALGAGGELTPAATFSGALNHGVLITAVSPRGRAKTVCYIQTNLADGADARLLRHVRAKAPFVTYLKSASYLMHGGGFDRVRSLILESSDSILQDDSGIPVRYFRPEVWDVTYYGSYRGTLEIFQSHYQPELANAFAAGQFTPLDFGLGYQTVANEAPLILARKRAPQLDLRSPGAGG